MLYYSVILLNRIGTLYTYKSTSSSSKSTTVSELKGGSYMLPWHAIPFLKAFGMLTPKPSENSWPCLWRSCKWQENTQLIIQWLQRSLVDGINGRMLVCYWSTPWRSGASPKGPEIRDRYKQECQVQIDENVSIL